MDTKTAVNYYAWQSWTFNPYLAMAIRFATLAREARLIRESMG